MDIKETRWQGEAIMGPRNHTLLQSEMNTGRSEFVVAFIMGSRCTENILGFQPISEMIRTVGMETKFINIITINVHIPTEDKEKEEDERRYVQL